MPSNALGSKQKYSNPPKCLVFLTWIRLKLCLFAFIFIPPPVEIKTLYLNSRHQLGLN